MIYETQIECSFRSNSGVSSVSNCGWRYFTSQTVHQRISCAIPSIFTFHRHGSQASPQSG